MKPTEAIAVYAARRSRLASLMGEGVAVLATAAERLRNRDSHYPYRYDSYFYYLTGFTEPEAALVLVAGSSPKSILFCRERDPERETWEGFRYGPQAARERFGLDEAQPIAALDEVVPRVLENQPTFFFPLGAEAEWDARAMRWLNNVRGRSRAGIVAPQRIHDLRSLLDDMRLTKDEHELAVMRRAADSARSSARV